MKNVEALEREREREREREKERERESYNLVHKELEKT